ncbi:MAG: hypothetical protein OEM60_06835, partial [Gammaproteobacteria bacterium]|nr:hypothetical protein [Gammaproteobacteria bacterium]
QYWQALVELQDQIYDSAQNSGDQSYHSFELPADLAPAGQPHLRRLAWHIDKKRVWQSFIVQEIDISASSVDMAPSRNPISILVLDTSQYGFQPSLDHGFLSTIARILTFRYFDLQVAGEHGNILDSQEAATDAFTASMAADGRSWMLASHHPYDALGRKSSSPFDKLRDAGGIPVTLSAHTHTGEILWHQDNRREGDWLEINVGSILDAPVEFRDLQVHRLGDRLAISSQRHLLEDKLRDDGLIVDNHPEYRPVAGDADFYLDYTNGLFGTEEEADFMVKRILLAAYLRMLQHFEADHPDQSRTYWPSGPDAQRLRSHQEVVNAARSMLAQVRIGEVAELTRFLYELREFDRTRKFSNAVSEQLRVYRLSQAAWASRAELTTWSAKTVDMDPDLSFLLLPRQAAAAPPQVADRADGP